MKTLVVVNLQYEATHQWSDCPSSLANVDFLKWPHRHMFYICCKKEVSDDNRQIEIIQFKREILLMLDKRFNGDFKGMSCEMIAKEIMRIENLAYCSVLEDGENGAEVWAKD